MVTHYWRTSGPEIINSPYHDTYHSLLREMVLLSAWSLPGSLYPAPSVCFIASFQYLPIEQASPPVAIPRKSLITIAGQHRLEPRTHARGRLQIHVPILAPPNRRALTASQGLAGLLVCGSISRCAPQRVSCVRDSQDEEHNTRSRYSNLASSLNAMHQLQTRIHVSRRSFELMQIFSAH